MKILVIDDDPMVLYTVSKILRIGGYDVATAANGICGMRQFRDQRPEVVITDIIMPEQEGIDTIRQIRCERPATKIIAISGGGRIANTSLLAMARKLGADEVIAKPFEAVELLDLLRLWQPGQASHSDNGTPVCPSYNYS